MLLSLIFLITVSTTSLFGQIKPFPSGIKVSFEDKNPINKKYFLIQKSDETNSKKSSRFLRIINALTDIPSEQKIAIIFYNKKGKRIEKLIITNTIKPTPEFIFFIDRKTGRDFQGKLDIYAFPQKATHFSIGIIDKKGKTLVPSLIPEFDTNNQLAIDYLRQFDEKKSYMWQIEITGIIERQINRLNVFYF
ncbi:MAG: hypothetical protein ACRCTJ_06860 [Brevinema sp.]